MKTLKNWLEENKELTSCIFTALFVIGVLLIGIGVIIN